MKNKTFNIRTLIDKDLKEQSVIFEGDLGLNNAEAIKKTIQTLKLNGEAFTIHLKNVEKLDITLIQIIKALRIALFNKGKKTKILSELPQDIERLLKNTGFDKTL
jgi:anti-anti-sigma regulatory factor